MLKKFDVVSKFDEVDKFGRSQRFIRTPSPQASEPALLCNFDEGEEILRTNYESLNQIPHSSTRIKSKAELEAEKSSEINVTDNFKNINLSEIELPPEKTKKKKRHKEKRRKSEKKDRSEKKNHKERTVTDQSNTKLDTEDTSEKMSGSLNLKDDTDNFLLTIKTGRTFMNDNDDLSKSRADDIDLDMNQISWSDDDDDQEYDRKLSNVKAYMPFLEMMIKRHRQKNDHKSLKKMESLREVLTQSNKKYVLH